MFIFEYVHKRILDPPLVISPPLCIGLLVARVYLIIKSSFVCLFVFRAKRPGNQDRSPCPSRWFLIYGLTFWKHWSFVVCVWLSLLAVSNAYRVSSPQTLRLCISYEISLYVLLPMTIQLSMSGQPSHPMKSLTSHKAPCRYELAHSKQFLVGEQLCKAQLTICTT